jgi:hypothetical protein
MSNNTLNYTVNTTYTSGNTTGDFPIEYNTPNVPVFNIPSTDYPWKVLPYQGEPWLFQPNPYRIQPQPIIPATPERPARKFDIVKKGKLAE